MVKDASQGISFICNNIAEYGGDPNRYFIRSFVCLFLYYFSYQKFLHYFLSGTMVYLYLTRSYFLVLLIH